MDDSNEIGTTHTKSGNIKIIMASEANEINGELFKWFLQRYQERLEESMKESEFVFDSVDLLHYHLQKYHLQKISLKRGGSYIDSPKWLKNKKVNILSIYFNRCIKS